MSRTAADLLPALAGRVTAVPVELRGIADDELRPRFMQFHRRTADLSPGRWELNLGVWHEGTLVGTQGRGIGTAMRQAICSVAFDHLGAEEISSGAVTDNPASDGPEKEKA